MNILIVEDSKAMRIIIQRTLRQAGFDGHAVREANNGAEALQMLGQQGADLVLCDWNMPEMSGLELLEKLRADGNRAKIGFITTESTPEMRQKAMDKGAQFVIAKPFTAENFSQVLGPHLS